MSVFLAFASLIIICILMKLINEKKNQRFYQLLKQFPSHQTYPLIGNLHLMLNPMEDMIEKWDKIMRPYDRQIFWFGSIPLLFLKKHEDIATIHSQCSDRDLMGKSDEWFGLGILNARYKQWKSSRRILNLAFTSQMLSKYLQNFKKNASILVENLQSVADNGEEVDVWPLMMKVSLDSIVENTMGVSIRNSENCERDFYNGINAALESIIQRLHSPWLFPNQVYKMYLKISRKTRIIHNFKFFPLQVLRKKLNELQNFQRQNNTNDAENSSRTVVDLLLKRSQNEADFTETRMRDELLQIMVPGIETTALNLSFLLLMLALHQDVQQKLYEEIAKFSTSHDNDNLLTEHDFAKNLGYLEQCIRETLRMFTPVTFGMRRTDKEILLGDKTVPANVIALTFYYLVNRNSELYQNPLKWDPAHFSEQAVKQRPKTSQLSFGYGARNCIGAKYAMLSMKVITFYILQRYHLSTNIKEFTPKDLQTDLCMRSKLGYPVIFTSRQETRK